MHLTTTPIAEKHCKACHQFEHSKLDGWGYCKAAPDFILGARLLPAETPCLFNHEWSARRA